MGYFSHQLWAARGDFVEQRMLLLPRIIQGPMLRRNATDQRRRVVRP